MHNSREPRDPPDPRMNRLLASMAPADYDAVIREPELIP